MYKIWNYNSTNSHFQYASLCKNIKMCFSDLKCLVYSFHSRQALEWFLWQQEESRICTICPQCQNLTAVSMYSLSRSWHYQELFNCRSAVNMFTALFSVNREMRPALRLQSNVEPLKTKDNAVLSRLAAFFGLSAHQNKQRICTARWIRARKSQSKPAVIIRGLLAHQASR